MKIFVIAAFLGFALAQECPNYVKIGCLKKNRSVYHTQVANNRDSSSNVYTGKVLDWNNYEQSLNELGCDCSKKVKELGGVGFAMGFYGECWMATDKDAVSALIIDTNQQSSNCIGHDYGACGEQKHCMGGADSLYVYGFPSAAPPAIDGKPGEWSEWSECSLTCGIGFAERERICNNPAASNGGKDCDGSELTETKSCKIVDCPVNGQWSEWGDYETCPVTCGGSTQKRTRKCDNPAPAFGGASCLGSDESSRKCGETPCPVDGKWGDWGKYETCPVTCGGSTQKRTRKCNKPAPAHGGIPCAGSDESSRKCGETPCPVDGKWGDWGKYETCPVTCGGSTQKRTRKCNNPAPAFGGIPCAGSDESSRKCGETPCPVNGNWGSWSSYGSCSKSCGNGQKSRSRSCNNPAPKYNGAACAGSSTQKTSCNTHNCPINGKWGSWSSYGSCSKSCGNGQKSRSRSCNSPAPKYNGAACAGSSTQRASCNTHNCPIDAKWSSWGSYGRCSKTCHYGTQSRSRTCSGARYNGKTTCVGSSTSTRNCNVNVRCPYWTGETTYRVCEGSKKVIECSDRNQVIKLQSYFWGRTSKSYCKGGVDWFWSTSCRGGHGRIANRCHNRNKCTLEANNSWMNDDPCWGTPKYAYIRYKCYG